MDGLEIDASDGVVSRNGGIDKPRRHRPAIHRDVQPAVTQYLLVMGDRFAVNRPHVEGARNCRDVVALWQFPQAAEQACGFPTSEHEFPVVR